MRAQLFALAIATVFGVGCVSFDGAQDTWCEKHPGQCGTPDSGNGGGGGTGGGEGGGEGGGGGTSEFDAGIDSGTPPECNPGASELCNVVNQYGSCPGGHRHCSDAGFWGSCGERTPPAPDICDGIDNDCDLQVDVPSNGCTCATPGTATPEKCSNGVDDDCDGLTDCPGEPYVVHKYGEAQNYTPQQYSGPSMGVSSVSAGPGGLFISGAINGTWDFVGGGGYCGGVNASSVFLAKLDPNTLGGIWQRTMPSGFSLTSVYADPFSGDVFATGPYIGSADFDGGISDSAPGKWGSYLVRFNSVTGDAVVARFLRDTSTDGGSTLFRSMTIAGSTADGGLVVAGYFDGTPELLPNGPILSTTGSGDVLIAEFGPALDLRSLHTFGGTGFETVSSAQTDNGSVVWVGGSANSQFSVGSYTVNGAARTVNGNAASTGYAFGYDLAADAGVAAVTVDGPGQVSAVSPGPTPGTVLIGGYLQDHGVLGSCTLNPLYGPNQSSGYLAATDGTGCLWKHVFIQGGGAQSLSISPRAVIAQGSGGSQLDWDAGAGVPSGLMQYWIGSFRPSDGAPIVFYADVPSSGIASVTPTAITPGWAGGSFNTYYGAPFTIAGQQLFSPTSSAYLARLRP